MGRDPVDRVVVRRWHTARSRLPGGALHSAQGRAQDHVRSWQCAVKRVRRVDGRIRYQRASRHLRLRLLHLTTRTRILVAERHFVCGRAHRGSAKSWGKFWMKPFLLISGDFVKTGGMDRANHALATYLANSKIETHIV